MRIHKICLQPLSMSPCHYQIAKKLETDKNELHEGMLFEVVFNEWPR